MQGGGSLTILDCNDACELAARRRVLAQAFDVAEHDSRVVKFPSDQIAVATREVQLVTMLERRLQEFLDDPKRRTMHLKPMKKLHRRLVKAIGHLYNLNVESVDPEPRRSVVFHKRNNSAVPLLLLSEALRTGAVSAADASNAVAAVEEQKPTPPGPASTSGEVKPDEEDGFQSRRRSKQSTQIPASAVLALQPDTMLGKNSFDVLEEMTTSLVSQTDDQRRQLVESDLPIKLTEDLEGPDATEQVPDEVYSPEALSSPESEAPA